MKDVASGADPTLLHTADKHIHLTSWNGKWLAFDQFDLENQTDVYALNVDSTDQVVSIANSPAAETGATFSPNGRWVAYASLDQGASEVWVASFPEGGAKHQISQNGGTAPHWSSESGELFYWQGTTLMVTRVSTDDVFIWDPAEQLFDAPDTWVPYVDYEVMPDGQHIILGVKNPDVVMTEIHVVTNWLEELRQRTGN